MVITMRKLRLRPQGFTVLELFTTVVVLLSLFIAFIALFYALRSYSQKSYRLLTASDVTYNKLLHYTSRPENLIPKEFSRQPVVLEDFSDELPVTLPAPHQATVTATPIGDSHSLYKITARIEYSEGRRPQTVMYAALVRTGGQIWSE